MKNDKKQEKKSNELLRMIKPGELSVEIKPVAANLKHSMITHWELRIFFNTRTQTITELTNFELKEVGEIIAEALDNIQNPEFISATLNFESEQSENPNKEVHE